MNNQSGKSPFLILDKNKWSDFINLGTVKQYQKNNTIVPVYSIIDKLFYILEGRVKYSLFDKNGNEKTLAIIGESTLFGEGPLFTKDPTNISAVAITNCNICEFPEEKVKEYINKNTELAIEMIKSMNYKIDIMIDQIENISFKCSKERIANLIYRLASNYGKKDNKDVHLNLAFTHQELANLAGCSRVSVSRVLATLKSERIIRYSRNQFTVINMERLKKINNTFSEK